MVEKLAGRVPIQVFDRAVVGQYVRLIGGEENREKVIVLFIAGVIGVLLAQRGAGAAGAGGAVVAVGDIEQRHLFEFFDQRLRVFVGDAPDGMGDAVGGGEVAQGISLFGALDVGINLIASAISEKDRAGLRAKRNHVARAVVFFVFASSFMFANDV